MFSLVSFPLSGIVLQNKIADEFTDTVVLIFTLHCGVCSSSSSLICWVPYSCVLNAHHVLTHLLPALCPSSCLEKDHLPLIICAYNLSGAGRYIFFYVPLILHSKLSWLSGNTGLLAVALSLSCLLEMAEFNYGGF